MTYSRGEIWLIIAILAVGTYIIRFSFIGFIGDKPMPPIVTRMLRFTPVAVLPGMVAPLVAWPAATDGVLDLSRLVAAAAALLAAYLSKNALLGMVSGGLTLAAGLYLTGQLG